MTREELEILYKEKILPENKEPYHFMKSDNSSIKIMAYNPICGDKFNLYINEGEGVIGQSFFHGIGCAISKASTSILIRKIEGMTVDNATELCRMLVISVSGKADYSFDDEELQILNELKNFDGRVDCVKLSWESMYEYLKDNYGD